MHEDIEAAVEYVMSLGQSAGATPAQSTEAKIASLPPQAERGRAVQKAPEKMKAGTRTR